MQVTHFALANNSLTEVSISASTEFEMFIDGDSFQNSPIRGPRLMTDITPPEKDDRKQPQKLPEIHSTDLFRGNRTILIIHSGEQYRLTITRNDKLILQK